MKIRIRINPTPTAFLLANANYHIKHSFKTYGDIVLTSSLVITSLKEPIHDLLLEI